MKISLNSFPKLIIFSIGFFLSYQCLAGNKIINFRYVEGHSQVFNLEKNQPETETLNSGLKGEDNYFLIRGGIRSPDFRPRITTTYFQKNLNQLTCQINNKPNTSLTEFIVGNNTVTVQENLNFFRTCVRFKIEDPNKGILEYDNIQENCNIEKIDDSNALLSGGDCFIKAKKDQILGLEVISNPACEERQFLVEKGFSPKEFLGDLQAYIYPKKELGPVFVPLKQLWSKGLLLTMDPEKELLNTVSVSDSEEIVIKRPDRLLLPDITFTDLKLRNEGGSTVVNLNLLISTFGGVKACNLGLCSNYLNYDVPLAPFLIVYERDPKNNKKYEIGTISNFGDRFPSQWNGEYQSMTILRGVQFEKGKKYSFDLIFSDPYQDYNRLKGYYKSMLRRGSMRINTGTARVGEDVLGTLGEGFSTLGTLGQLPDLGGDIFGEIPHDLKDMIPRILETLNDPSFPPQYSEVCNKSMKTCNKASGKEHLRFVVNFEVKDIQGSQVILDDNIEIEQKSNLIANSKDKLDLKNKQTINCK